MSMKSKDLLQLERDQFAAAMAAAIKSGDEEQMAKAFATYNASVQEAIITEANEAAVMQSRDATVLAGRGVRQLTSSETKYYKALGEALGSNTPKMALANIEVAMPKTVMDTVLEDIRTSHPLLERISFRNTYGVVKMIINAQVAQSAVWGKLTAAILGELSGAFKEVDADASKLTAFMPVSKELLTLGPQWLDSYVREILSEALAVGLEKAIVTGTGKDMFIGMDRDVGPDASVVSGEYPKMDAIAITDLSAETFGTLCEKVARHPLDPTKGRVVNDLVLIVNPLDYWGKVMPATTYLLPTGEYRRDVLPIAAEIIQSEELARNEAIFGMAKRYFAGMGLPKDGKIEYDDSVHFLEDERVYTIKTVGTGFPLDEYAFLRLDISGLKPRNLSVVVKEVQGVVKTKEQTT